jgi:hypothetical protein
MALEPTGSSSATNNSEMIRRIFWCTWVANCISSDHYLPGTWADPPVMGLPLPCSQSAFQEQSKELPRTLLSVQDQSLAPEHTPPRDNSVSVAAELMKLILIW